jgi:hypothetical protein
MNESLIDAIVSLLESGDDEGCDGLVVVTVKAYGQLRAALEQTTGQLAGIDVAHQIVIGL